MGGPAGEASAHEGAHTMRTRPRGRVLIVGQYVDQALATERALPSNSWAGSNRMRRLGSAIQAGGQRVTIVAPGAALRMARTCRLFYPVVVRRAGRASVVFARAVGFPLIGLICEPWLMIVSLYTLVRRRDVAAALIYNFSPGLLICALVLKRLWRIRIILDLEDVSIPRLSDWRRDSIARPWQQCVYWACMRSLLKACDGVIVPTRRFLVFVPDQTPSIVVSGCLEESDLAHVPALPDEGPLRVLMAGKLDRENGFDTFVSAAELLSGTEKGGKYEFHACGSSRAGTLKSGAVRFHGSLPSTEYRRLLGMMDVCVVLQRQEGRWAGLKTPSKIYEFLGAGKVVVATDAGDYAEIVAPFLRVCAAADSETLRRILEEIEESRRFLSEWSIEANRHAMRLFSSDVVGRDLVPFVLGTMTTNGRT